VAIRGHNPYELAARGADSVCRQATRSWALLTSRVGAPTAAFERSPPGSSARSGAIGRSSREAAKVQPQWRKSIPALAR
jgi:hypothetical protein